MWTVAADDPGWHGMPAIAISTPPMSGARLEHVAPNACVADVAVDDLGAWKTPFKEITSVPAHLAKDHVVLLNTQRFEGRAVAADAAEH